MASILIVDDDPTIRAMFARALKDLGEISQASNGADALRLLGAQKFTVVLLDLHMPVIDGFVILHTLATKPGPNKETPVYVVTADCSDQARIRALRRHAVFFLTKPVPIGTLVNLVDATLKKAASRAATPARPASATATSLGAALGKASATPASSGSDGKTGALQATPKTWPPSSPKKGSA